MCFRLLQSLYKQVKVCGVVDTLIGLIAVFVIASPVIFCDYIEPLPALFGYFIVLCAIGVPVAISLGLSTLATIICADTLPIEYMAQVAFTSIDSFPIMAIPFFIAAGVFMGAGGLSHRLLSLADEIVGGTYGGIGLTAIVTCMFFGAILRFLAPPPWRPSARSPSPRWWSAVTTSIFPPPSSRPPVAWAS